jgi:carbonic anhydrase/acetyltransferase-like protein (isoleucine patch superfamily)
MAVEEMKPAPEESSPASSQAKKLKLPLPKLPFPRFDPTALVVLSILVGGSALTTFLGIRLMMPERVVMEAPSAEGQEHGQVFNPKGLANFTTGPNALTGFNMRIERPVVAEGAYVHPQAALLGFVNVGPRVFVAPHATIRADVGQNIRILDESNIQPGAVIQGQPTEEKGKPVLKNQVLVNGQSFSVHLGRRVSIDAQAQVHGPAALEEDVYVGMQALVQHARVGKGTVIAPRAVVIGVVVPAGRYVPVGQIVTRQAQADALPSVEQAGGYLDMHRQLVKASVELASGYLALHTPGGKGVGKPHP